MRISDWSSDVCSSDLHVSPAVDDIDVAGVAAHDAGRFAHRLTGLGDGRLAHAENGVDVDTVLVGDPIARQARPAAIGRPRPELGGGRVADQRSALLVVAVGQQRFPRTLENSGIAAPGFAVGTGPLGAAPPRAPATRT